MGPIFFLLGPILRDFGGFEFSVPFSENWVLYFWGLMDGLGYGAAFAALGQG